MILKQCLLTKNDCYKSGKTIKPSGIVVHSTGANNPNLRRYIQPDDGILGANKYNNHWNRSGVNKCVNAFIGKALDNQVMVYQTLPWDRRPWGCGSGKKGSYNNSHIQFEICEDALNDSTYFNDAFGAAIELCAYLAKEYDIKVSNIVSHHEAYLAGYASGHSDCDHWLKKFNKDMDWFRKQVQDKLDSVVVVEEPVREDETVSSDKQVWDFLIGKGLSAYATAGIMGNIRCESNFISINLQNSFEKKFNVNDITYTEQVDAGTRNFIDSAGYGLCQWTYYSRKQALLDFAKSQKKSIGDLAMQLEYMWKEMSAKKSMMKELKAATSVQQASNIFLLQFERPAKKDDPNVQANRAKYGEEYFEKYDGSKSSKYLVKIDTPVLNIRKGAGTKYKIVGTVKKGEVYTIVEESNGWGKLKSGAGWISLAYTSKY